MIAAGANRAVQVVTLDGLLCPSFFRDLVPDDWDHNVGKDFRTELFRDAEHVVRRTAGSPVNILGLLEDPTADDVRSFAEPGFAFCGFDLVDSIGGISALLNCSGFDKAFAPLDLSPECGLVTDLGRAREIQRALLAAYPAEPHARCELWALWRRRTEGGTDLP